MSKISTIGIFEPVDRATGGSEYRSAIRQALEKRYDVEVVRVPGAKGPLPSARLRRMWEIARVKKRKDLWIRDFFPVAAKGLPGTSGKSIALLHHMYTEGEEYDALGRLLESLFARNIKRCERVVAVSRFWKEYLQRRFHLADVRTIYNALDADAFSFHDDEIAAFKKKYFLDDSTVIYLGNCRKNKGVAEVYEALKDRDYLLLTSGEPDIMLPCPNLILPYREYQLLLKVSAVIITMSTFREGWCRTAHEAMLCKTPVIGSGAGGMAELLEGGQQFICRNIADLPALVETAIKERKKRGEDGFAFVSRFTRDAFDRAWVSLVEEVMADETRGA
jgi:glycosyltransferase involved in cell wall biosynthesis